MQLQDIAQVKTGLVLNRKRAVAESEIAKTYKQINLRAVDPEGQVDLSKLEPYDSIEKLSQDYITQRDDIIVKLIEPFTAVYIDESLEGLLVPAHYCLIKNINKKKYLPKFISFYLNTEAVSKQFYNSLQGVTVKNIKPTTLQELDVIGLPIAEQQQAVTLLELQQQKLTLLQKLKEKEQIKQKSLTDILLKNKGVNKQ